MAGELFRADTVSDTVVSGLEGGSEGSISRVFCSGGIYISIYM